MYLTLMDLHRYGGKLTPKTIVNKYNNKVWCPSFYFPIF